MSDTEADIRLRKSILFYEFAKRELDALETAQNPVPTIVVTDTLNPVPTIDAMDVDVEMDPVQTSVATEMTEEEMSRRTIAAHALLSFPRGSAQTAGETSGDGDKQARSDKEISEESASDKEILEENDTVEGRSELIRTMREIDWAKELRELNEALEDGESPAVSRRIGDFHQWYTSLLGVDLGTQNPVQEGTTTEVGEDKSAEKSSHHTNVSFSDLLIAVESVESIYTALTAYFRGQPSAGSGSMAGSQAVSQEASESQTPQSPSTNLQIPAGTSTQSGSAPTTKVAEESSIDPA
ncbi:hypothetical protein BCR39DRAFT_591430 [Naematelia encephala]|uniref:Uncharacterized protein n=1 Tax=Naematelia encephala TaxID=71784 RepID=A0A1Y2AHJ4_9TREE|nr:hypothetical protein BCR39DRAFT_591430 [Naematelia encephala]